MSQTNTNQNIIPNFLVIGTMRSGTTWLDGVLRTHPDIYLPQRRKEVHFFDQYYERGIEWYQNFFSFADDRLNYKSIGEITPDYLYHPEVPARIKKHIPNCKFIVIFRNPVDRAYSHYGFMVKNYADTRSFEEIVEQKPDVFPKGLYGEQMERYLQLFPLNNFLILIYEEVLNNPEKTLEKIAHFLSVEPDKFDISMVNKRANSSGTVRFSAARALACKFRDFLRNQDLDWVWDVAKKSGMEGIFESKGKSLPPINPQIKAELISRYESDITLLEKLINTDLSIWKNSTL